MVKLNGIDLSSFVLKTCQITCGMPTKMLKSAFIRMCRDRYDKKLRSFRGADTPAHPECINCKTGELIAAGKDFPQPDDIEAWIELPAQGKPVEAKKETRYFRNMADFIAVARLQRDEKREAKVMRLAAEAEDINEQQQTMLHIVQQGETMKTQWKEEWSEVLQVIPAEKLQTIKRNVLRLFWLKPVLRKGDVGLCPNCLRDNMTIRWSGLCSTCEKSCNNLTGPAMLDNLTAVRRRVEHLVSNPVHGSRPYRKNDRIKQEAGKAVAAEASDYKESELYRVGKEYAEIGARLMDATTPLAELIAITRKIGLQIDINITARG